MAVAQRLDMDNAVVENDARLNQSVVQCEIDLEAALRLFHECEQGRPQAWIRQKQFHRLARHAADVARIQLAHAPQQLGEASRMVDVGVRNENRLHLRQIQPEQMARVAARFTRVEPIQAAVDVQHP